MSSCMSRLSRRGKTVIFSIHQPRYSIFRQFDHLTLMHKGEMVYSGPADHSVEYFTTLGMSVHYKKCHTLLMFVFFHPFMHMFLYRLPNGLLQQPCWLLNGHHQRRSRVNISNTLRRYTEHTLHSNRAWVGSGGLSGHLNVYFKLS